MSSRIDELDVYVPLAVIEMVDSLEAENERLRADAERYRWLRDHGVAYAICKYESGGPGEHDWCGWLPFDTRSTDAAIDAAMKGEK